MRGTIKVTKVGAGKSRTKKKTAKKTAKKKTSTKKKAAKSTRKSTAKKTKTTKKKTTKRTAKKKQPLVHADPSQVFWVCTGAVLADLTDLERALDEMTDEEFGHHVNSDKNDFAEWVENVLDDSECARGLRRTKRRMAARTCVTKRLAHYEL